MQTVRSSPTQPYPTQRKKDWRKTARGGTAPMRKRVKCNNGRPLLQVQLHCWIIPFMNMTMATLGKFARRAGPRVMAV